MAWGSSATMGYVRTCAPASRTKAAMQGVLQSRIMPGVGTWGLATSSLPMLNTPTTGRRMTSGFTQPAEASMPMA